MTIKLPENPKTAGLRDICHQLREQSRAGQDVVIDASAIASLPIGYVQLLLSAAKTARASGRAIKLLNPSFPCLFAFESVGIAPDQGLFDIGYGTC